MTRVMSLLVMVPTVFLVFTSNSQAVPGNFVLLPAKSVHVDRTKRKFSLTFALPCYDEDALEASTLIQSSDDSGDMTLAFGLVYPAGYCMDFIGDPKAKPKDHVMTLSTRKYGINKNVEVEPLDLLEKKK